MFSLKKTKTCRRYDGSIYGLRIVAYFGSC